MDDASTRKYHVAHQGRKFGPLSLVELSSRRLSSDMLVWCEGMPEWVPISAIAELRGYVHHATTSHTVAPPTASNGAVPMTATSSFRGNASSSSTPPSVAPAFVPPTPPTPPSGGAGRIKFLGISMIVLASVGLLCCPLSALGTITQEMPEVLDGQTIAVVHGVLYTCMVLVSIPLLIAGTGLLRGRRWAALTGTLSSVGCIVLNLAASAFDCGFVQLPLLNVMEHAGDREALGGLVIVFMLGALATIAGIIWHTVMIFLLNSTIVRQNLR